MAKEMLINVSDGEETRIALVEDGHLEELYMERSSSTSHVGNIYKGKVTNVEASIQAAFIDFGLGRNGFLHITDLMPTYFGQKGEDIQETVGRKMARRDRPPIQRCLRRGDEIIVQIIKEGIGTKGPTLSSYLSIPGRILVMMPGMSRLGVSKKIEDDAERRRLRQILDGLKPPKDVGFIIRTAGVGKTKLEIQRDFTYLSRLWMQIDKKLQSGPGPMELYTEGDLVTRTVRDVFTSDVDQIVVDNEEVAKRVREVIKITAPRTKNKVELYTDPVPLFHKYGIEKDIELMHSRHVPLPSGGSLVIDSTEAIVAIDVNSGKFRDHSDAETTAFKTDMEAAEEIPRQLRLRDLGGVIICDFIDLRYERHRRELEEKLHEKFKNDRAKTKVLRMSQFGIIEMTRQRMRPSLKRSIYFDCPHCKGAGLVKTPESMGLDVMRRLAIAAHDQRVVRVELAVCPEVAFYLQNRKRSPLADLEDRTQKRIVIKGDQSLALDEVKLELYDVRDGLVYLSELGMSPADSQPPRKHGRDQGRPDRNQQRGRGGKPPEPARRRESAPLEDAFDLDQAEDAVEEREETREADDTAALPALPPPAQQQRPEPAERPESYSNFTDNDVDLGDEDEDDDVQPMSNERPPQPRGRHDNRGGPRRDIVRNDNSRGQAPREGNRRDEPRRDDQQRGDQNQRGDYRRGQPQGQPAGRPQGGQSQGQRPPQHQGGRPPLPPGNQGGRPQQNQPGSRPPQQPGNRPQQGVRPQPQGQPRGESLAPGQVAPGVGDAGGEFSDVNGEGGPRRRRRRRRGGRGRNRNRQGQAPLGQENDPNAVPSANASFDDYGDEGDEVTAAAPESDRNGADRFDDQGGSAPDGRDDLDREDRSEEQTGLFDENTPAETVASDRRDERDEPDERDELSPPSEQPAEDAQPVGGLVEELNAEAPGAEPPEEAAPKKTRSRGGSGKGRGKGTSKPAKSPAPTPAAKAKTAAAASPKSRGRGTRGSGRGKGGKGAATADVPVDAGSEAQGEASPPATTAPEPVVRTGSTDRHQLIVDEIADEPILTPEPRRPRTYRDLDEIPDDLD